MQDPLHVGHVTGLKKAAQSLVICPSHSPGNSQSTNEVLEYMAGSRQPPRVLKYSTMSRAAGLLTRVNEGCCSATALVGHDATQQDDISLLLCGPKTMHRD